MNKSIREIRDGCFTFLDSTTRPCIDMHSNIKRNSYKEGHQAVYKESKIVSSVFEIERERDVIECFANQRNGLPTKGLVEWKQFNKF